MEVVRLTALFAVLAFSGVFLGQDFWWLAAIMLLFAFFWDASLPQLEAATLNHLREQAGTYAHIRLWGSIGFIVTVMGLGRLLDQVHIWWLLPSLLVLMIGIWLFTLIIPESQMQAPRMSQQPFYRVFARTEVWGFMLACFLMQASHGPYYTFYSIYLDTFGYSKTLIGALWAFGVICEIGIFLMMHRVNAWLDLRRILLVSFGVAAGRWLLIGLFPENLGILIFAQALHAVTFGAYHAAAIQMVQSFFTGRHQVRGQAMYSSASFGLGGALGSVYSGVTWERLGATGTFGVAAITAAAAVLVTYWLIRPKV